VNRRKDREVSCREVENTKGEVGVICNRPGRTVRNDDGDIKIPQGEMNLLKTRSGSKEKQWRQGTKDWGGRNCRMKLERAGVC